MKTKQWINKKNSEVFQVVYKPQSHLINDSDAMYTFKKLQDSQQPMQETLEYSDEEQESGNDSWGEESIHADSVDLENGEYDYQQHFREINDANFIQSTAPEEEDLDPNVVAELNKALEDEECLINDEQFFDSFINTKIETPVNDYSSRLIDQQFDHMLEHYDESEDDEDEDEEGNDFDHYDSVFDDFLQDLKILGRDRLVKRNPHENLDSIRNELKTQAKEVLEKYSYVDDSPIDTSNMAMPVMKERGWDVESILSVNSNLYNHPKIINDFPKLRISLRKGIPKVRNPIMNEVLEDIEEQEQEQEEKENKGEKRPKDESSAEKKERKQKIKQEKRERKLEKKELKNAFAKEFRDLGKVAGNLKLQKHSIQLQ